MDPSRARLAVGTAAALFALSCRASMQGDASAQMTADQADVSADADLDAEVRNERAAMGPESENSSVEMQFSGEQPLLGARRDLSLAVDRAPLSCSCLKLGLGQPTDAAFRWKGTPPVIDAESQLIVGLSSEGVTCTHPKGSLGASYWGYRRSGNDVVVFVESAVKGRPMTAGAIIPKPFGDGQVFAAPAFKNEPYGRGPNGEPRCKLGNPGPQRSASPPQSDDE